GEAYDGRAGTAHTRGGTALGIDPRDRGKRTHSASRGGRRKQHLSPRRLPCPRRSRSARTSLPGPVRGRGTTLRGLPTGRGGTGTRVAHRRTRRERAQSV